MSRVTCERCGALASERACDCALPLPLYETLHALRMLDGRAGLDALILETNLSLRQLRRQLRRLEALGRVVAAVDADDGRGEKTYRLADPHC